MQEMLMQFVKKLYKAMLDGIKIVSNTKIHTNLGAILVNHFCIFQYFEKYKSNKIVSNTKINTITVAYFNILRNIIQLIWN